MKRNLVLLAFIVLKFILSYALVNPVFELHRDEFLHLDQANHLAFGYLSVPPLTSWVALLIKLLGNGVFWVKFFPCLFGALTMAIVWKAIESLGGSWFALITGATAILLSVLLRLNILFQPNSFEVLAWTFIYFSLLRYIQSGNVKWLYFAATGVALGFLNKYNIAFMVLGLLPALLLSPQRSIFVKKKFWLAASLGAILILPNLIWQFTNGFPVIHHMKELKETQLVNVDRGDFLKEQLLFFFGSIHILIAAFIGLLTYKPLRPYRLFLWAFLLSLGLFVVFQAKGYYAIGLYPILFAFGAVYLEKRLKGKPGMVLQAASVALTVGFFIATYPLAFPVDEPAVIKERVKNNPDLHLSRWEDGKDHELPQDFADMLGWKELASKTDAALATLPSNEHTIILCDNYGQTGAINFYKKDKRANAVSFNADYLNWFDLEKPIQNIILVQEASDDDTNRKRVRALFESMQKIGEITNPFAREKGTSVYVLKSAKVDVNAILRSKIESEKRSWK
ncbi:MAG: glycosyltransferase family 39 protein [Flavobacterium sp.]|uniref:glycosyltransferase family 39 protein n=1 Tax=Flavobacterium sp. TaxID=239 RepID=UPI00121E90C9|nr:glycosyltransferase family 39 protein [Flavobacterium sp.]RZJ64402.1 MAG: glycosyltransferase family 39 protein [Flavobacterium sp.]